MELRGLAQGLPVRICSCRIPPCLNLRSSSKTKRHGAPDSLQAILAMRHPALTRLPASRLCRGHRGRSRARQRHPVPCRNYVRSRSRSRNHAAKWAAWVMLFTFFSLKVPLKWRSTASALSKIRVPAPPPTLVEMAKMMFIVESGSLHSNGQLFSATAGGHCRVQRPTDITQPTPPAGHLTSRKIRAPNRLRSSP